MNATKVKWILIISSTFVLLYPAFYNGFPFVYSDTGAYIHSGFENQVPDDRPIFYGLFLRHSSLATSLWFSVFMQSFIIAWILYEVTELITNASKFSNQTYAVSIAVLATFTGLPYYISTMLPDIFVSISFLLLCFLLFKDNSKKRWYNIFPIVVFLFFALTHLSNLVAFSIFAFGFFVSIYFFKQHIFKLSQGIKIMLLCFSLWLIIPSVNALFGAGFKVNKASSVFMVAKLSENGLLKEYLNKEASATNLKIYLYKDSLPIFASDFIWDTNSPLYKSGGWEANLDEYQFVVGDMLSNPHYFKKFIAHSFVDGLRQLFNTQVGEEFIPYQQGSSPALQVEWHFKDDIQSYYQSRQNNNCLNIDFDRVATKQNILLALSLLIVVLYLLKNGLQEKKGLFCLIILLFIIANAFTAGSLSMVVSRYNARVIWLIIFAASMISAEYIFNIRDELKERNVI